MGMVMKTHNFVPPVFLYLQTSKILQAEAEFNDLIDKKNAEERVTHFQKTKSVKKDLHLIH